MRKTLIFILVFLSLISIGLQLGSGYIAKILGVNSKAGIRIESNKKSQVLINSNAVGETPYQDENLVPGDYLIDLKDSEATASAKSLWQGYAKLNQGTLTIVVRDLAETKEASAGEIISLEKGQGATIISSPTGAEVFIDGKVVGRTPITVPTIGAGEHQFIISRENFLKRSIRSKVIEDLNLVINVDLALSEADLTNLPSTPISSSQEIVIKNTPTGFLRVRESASLNGKEIGQVKPKETLVLLEETPGWVRIRLKDGKEGWVSSAYIQKKNP